MDTHIGSSRRSVWCRVGLAPCLFLCLVVLLACGGAPPAGGEGEGPGHRPQYLALTPAQELSLGRQAYEEVLAKYRGHIVRNGKEAEAVRDVGERIVRAAEIKPLQREINLHFDERYLEWQFTLIDDRPVNAFCLPGGKVVVFTGLFSVVKNKDELAAVMGHEIGHALAHHASERIYRGQDKGLSGLAFDRAQESEADHIGLFLMTFAGFNPDACIALWEDMGQRGGHGSVPEILSDHPSDAHRIGQMKQWVPFAKAGLQAYKEGRIAQ
jgi:metalloendopeptidase OMA1, mitochondrial